MYVPEIEGKVIEVVPNDGTVFLGRVISSDPKTFSLEVFTTAPQNAIYDNPATFPKAIQIRIPDLKVNQTR